MADVTPVSGLPPPAASPYRAPATTPASQDGSAPLESEKPKVEAAKPAKQAEVSGFNPSAKIDPTTHIVVLTVKGPDGKTIRQIPTEQQMAAYDTQAKRPQA